MAQPVGLSPDSRLRGGQLNALGVRAGENPPRTGEREPRRTCRLGRSACNRRYATRWQSLIRLHPQAFNGAGW